MHLFEMFFYIILPGPGPMDTALGREFHCSDTGGLCEGGAGRAGLCAEGGKETSVMDSYLTLLVYFPQCFRKIRK